MSLDNEQTTRFNAVAPAATPEPSRKRKRKAATVGGMIAAAIVGAGGVAIAAILPTTNITGATTVTTVNTSNDIDVSASSADGSRLICSPISVSDDNVTLTLNPKLTKPVGGANSSGVPIDGGRCTVKLAVKNTGDTPIRLDANQTTVQFPAGWTVESFTGPATGSIAPNATAEADAVIVATYDAVAGPISGKLVYTDAA